MAALDFSAFGEAEETPATTAAPLDFSRFADPVTTSPAVPAPRSKPFLTGETVGRTSEGRPLIRNTQGGVSSEYSITEQDPRDRSRFMNLPSIYGGEALSADEAVRRVVEAGYTDPETGRAIKSFASQEEAVAAAKQRSSAITQRLNPDVSLPPAFDDQGFFRRSVINPFRVGGHQLGVTAGAGGAAVSGQRIQALNRIDELQGQGRPDDALKYVLELQDPEISEYARTRDPTRRGELRNRITTGLTYNISQIGQHQEAIGGIPRNPRLKAALESRSIQKLGRAILDDPEIILQVTGESLPQFAPGIVAAPLLGPVVGFGGGSLFAEHGTAPSCRCLPGLRRWLLSGRRWCNLPQVGGGAPVWQRCSSVVPALPPGR